jgi:4-hydroxy-4-methyl-2-oxoglutarate aldolase
MDSQNSVGTSNFHEICERYRRLYAGAVYDVLEEMGHPNQALSHELTALSPGMKLAGPAFTVKGTVTAERAEADRETALQMVCSMKHPCIEVRDRGTSFNVAIYGELSATTAKAHGAVGALVDGGTRDSGQLVKMDFPVFSRYRSPVEAFGRYMILRFQVPIHVSGELTDTVEIKPGDFIFGEEDGVLVIPKALILRVLNKCEEVKSLEDKARSDFARGDDPVEVFKRYKRL